MYRISCQKAIIKGIKAFCEKEDYFIKEDDILKIAEEVESSVKEALKEWQSYFRQD